MTEQLSDIPELAGIATYESAARIGYSVAANVERWLPGNFDEGIEALNKVLSVPSYSSRSLLRVDPLPAPLRKDPRFQRLVSEK